MPVQIRKVDTQADFKPYFEFPWVLYQGDPNWTPPLLSMRREQYDKKKNPAWEYIDGDFFAAYRDGRIVGTIAAYINQRHNEYNDEEIGWFGAFEVEDDPEAASALLDTAAEWVRARGFKTIRGPQTFTTHEETGLLVDGFTRPILLMPYNKPYYEKLVLGANFHPVMDTYSFHLSRDEVNQTGLLERLERITKAIMKRNHVVIRPIDGHNLKGEFALFKELYNAAWEKNWGFTPMTPKELDAMVKSLGQFFDPSLAFFGEVDGEPVGFIMAVPDFNQVLKKVYPKPGTPEAVSLVKALYHWKLNPIIDWARVPLMGVKEAYRSKGVDAALYFHVLDAMLKGRYQHCDSGWILSINQNMVSIAKNFGSQIYKTYRYYEKALE
ncbi:MAG: GNAT family N-acetyltransferase [Chloroflexota bacterium]